MSSQVFILEMVENHREKIEKSIKLPSGFCDFFSNLLTCPASAASIE